MCAHLLLRQVHLSSRALERPRAVCHSERIVLGALALALRPRHLHAPPPPPPRHARRTHRDPAGGGVPRDQAHVHREPSSNCGALRVPHCAARARRRVRAPPARAHLLPRGAPPLRLQHGLAVQRQLLRPRLRCGLYGGAARGARAHSGAAATRDPPWPSARARGHAYPDGHVRPRLVGVVAPVPLRLRAARRSGHRRPCPRTRLHAAPPPPPAPRSAAVTPPALASRPGARRGLTEHGCARRPRPRCARRRRRRPSRYARCPRAARRGAAPTWSSDGGSRPYQTLPRRRGAARTRGWT